MWRTIRFSHPILSAVPSYIGSVAKQIRSSLRSCGNITDGYPAYLAEHEGRLFATTWAYFDSQGASLWMSPVIQAGGLTTADADSWETCLGSYGL